MNLRNHKNILTLLLSLAMTIGLSSISFTQEDVPEEALPVEDEADLKEDVIDGRELSGDAADDTEISADIDVEDIADENEGPELDANELGQERERQVEDYNQAAAIQQQLQQNELAAEAEDQTVVADEEANGNQVQLDPRSYALGVALAANVVDTYGPLDLDYRAFGEGFEDALSGDELALSEEQITQYVQATRQQLMQNAQGGGGSAQATENLEQGRDFLEENAKREGVNVTESGLQYMVMEEGEGESPTPTDRVQVNYTGTLLNGQVFDSTDGRGPATFGVNQVIPGWTEGLQLMKEGAKYKFFIPSELAYGPRGAGGRIGPNETLIFEVELLDVMN